MKAVSDRLVADDLRAVIPLLPDLDDIEHRLDEVRTALGGSEGPSPDPAILTVERIYIPGGGGHRIPALLYRPRARPVLAPALLNIHGGGFVAGTALREDEAMRQLALDLGCVILSVDYRLAPEYPYPAPIDDCEAAFRWLVEHAGMLEINSDLIAVRGVSAGGGLAAALASRVRNHSGPGIALLLLVYPMLDDRTRDHPVAGQHVWTARSNEFAWRAYLGNAINEPPADAVPARSTDLYGMPPTMIAIGSIDLFIDEAMSFARRLISAGVPTSLVVYPGAFHGFNLVVGSRSASAFERDCRSALADAFKSEKVAR